MINLTLLLMAQSLQAGVYKWLDENGKTHYGEEVPEKYKAEKINKSTSNYFKNEPVEGLAFLYVIDEISYQKNTDRFGGDLKKIRMARNAKASQCRNECNHNKKCSAWTYMKPSYNPDDEHTNCYLKWKPEMF